MNTKCPDLDYWWHDVCVCDYCDLPVSDSDEDIDEDLYVVIKPGEPVREASPPAPSPKPEILIEKPIVQQPLKIRKDEGYNPPDDIQPGPSGNNQNRPNNEAACHHAQHPWYAPGICPLCGYDPTVEATELINNDDSSSDESEHSEKQNKNT